MLDEKFEIPFLDAYQKKVIESKLGSKLIWGSAFSGKTLTLCLRAKALLEKNISPLVLCFSTHHRRLIRMYLVNLGIHEKVRVLTFKEWMLNQIAQKNSDSVASYTRVINREESLLWLKKHQNEWSGNDDPSSDLEIIWTEKIFSPEGQPSDYQDLVSHYQHYLKQNHLIDEIDLCSLFDKKIIVTFKKDEFYFLIDEAQEASVLEVQILAKLVLKNTAEIFVDYNQGVMAWRTPLPPMTLKEFKKYLKVKKYFYLKHNYFNSKAIINIGSKLIRKNKNRISKKMKSISLKKGEAHFYLFDSVEAEGNYIADCIQKWSKDPLHQEDQIGILVRNHQQAQEISVYLEKVLTSPYYAHSLMRQPSAQKILALIRMLLNNASDTDYDVLMNDWFDAKVKESYYALKKALEIHPLYFSYLVKTPFLRNYLQENKKDFVLIQKVFSPTSKIDIYSLEKWDQNKLLNSGLVTIEQLDEDQIQTTFEKDGELIWCELTAGNSMGFYHGFYAPTCQFIPGLFLMEKNHLLKDDESKDFFLWEKVNSILTILKSHKDFLFNLDEVMFKIKKEWSQHNLNDLKELRKFTNLFKSVDSFGDLSKLNEVFLNMFLQHLTPLKNFERFSKLSRTSISKGIHDQSRITLCTIHEGRHLQCQKLFVPRLNQFEFPHAESSIGTKLEEERRLFFVALMRCEGSVVLSSVKKNHHISSFIRDAGIM